MKNNTQSSRFVGDKTYCNRETHNSNNSNNSNSKKNSPLRLSIRCIQELHAWAVWDPIGQRTKSLAVSVVCTCGNSYANRSVGGTFHRAHGRASTECAPSTWTWDCPECERVLVLRRAPVFIFPRYVLMMKKVVTRLQVEQLFVPNRISCWEGEWTKRDETLFIRKSSFNVLLYFFWIVTHIVEGVRVSSHVDYMIYFSSNPHNIGRY